MRGGFRAPAGGASAYWDLGSGGLPAVIGMEITTSLLAEKLDTPFDFIVVGAGSVLARRLVDDGKKVAVLEAGGVDSNPMIADLTSLAGLWHGPEDWDYFTTEQEHCSGRRLHLPRGKVLGGSHALNAAIWVRGAKQDYDTWAYLGNAGWSWEDVLPVFKEIENYDGGASETRGGSGLLDVVKGFPINPVQESIVEAAQEIGIKLNEDYNSGDVEGVSKMQLNIRDGKRFNTWHRCGRLHNAAGAHWQHECPNDHDCRAGCEVYYG